ncbi:MAG: Flp pilus assembly complex ATPase component TadA [Candidatus Riflebacteria bacterium]|nr:Flp pilus assembly complex ATPase component TadA [Candidatus Riflebacteria bacterium]
MVKPLKVIEPGVPDGGLRSGLPCWLEMPEPLTPDTVVAAVDRVLADLDRLGVSDLHLDPQASGYLVRFRKDGAFVDLGRRSCDDAGRLIARLKVMARLAVYRTDVAQEGSLALPEGRGSVRLSTIPTVNGERAVLRFLGVSEAYGDLESLGFDPDFMRRYRALLATPQGLVLVTGPSGSGKTTTLYASIKEIARHQGSYRSIVTLEDPVERNLGDVVQMEVSAERGLTFPTGLKALLRQNPEVLMVGEIRDRETAQIAVQAGLTGHLVLSSLHTSSSVEALIRLQDLGIEPGLVAGAIKALVSQRLVPLLCRHGDSDAVRCSRCGNTGLAGRRAIGELM